jgi:O-methyltransferase involved in polyketide biosynthesis
VPNPPPARREIGGSAVDKDVEDNLADRIDTTVAHPARVYDYWLGGTDNFAADREAAEQVITVRPTIIRDIGANRELLGRVVRYLVAEAGVRQLLDLGAGLPAMENVHEVAQRIAPEARVVYVDNDPIVQLHAQALLTSSPSGRTVFTLADLRDTDAVMEVARAHLDLARPVGLLLIGVLHLIGDDEDPYGLVARLLEPLPSGSFLAITHPASDVHAEMVAEGARRYNERVSTPQTRRSHDEVVRLFAGTELVEPGVVQFHRWRPDRAGAEPRGEVSGYGGVGRKP